MKLKIALPPDCKEKTVENVTVKQITDSVETMAWDDISWVSLHKDEYHSLTASGSKEDGFSLTYVEGDMDHEYFADPPPENPAEIISVLQSFRQGQDWRKNRKWEIPGRESTYSQPTSDESTLKPLILLIAIAVVIAVIIWLVMGGF